MLLKWSCQRSHHLDTPQVRAVRTAAARKSGTRDFAALARMAVQLKDMRNVLDTAQSLGFEAPISTLFEHLYAQAIGPGLTDLDHSGLFVE